MVRWDRGEDRHGTGQSGGTTERTSNGFQVESGGTAERTGRGQDSQAGTPRGQEGDRTVRRDRGEDRQDLDSQARPRRGQEGDRTGADRNFKTGRYL